MDAQQGIQYEKLWTLNKMIQDYYSLVPKESNDWHENDTAGKFVNIGDGALGLGAWIFCFLP